MESNERLGSVEYLCVAVFFSVRFSGLWLQISLPIYVYIYIYQKNVLWLENLS